MPRLSLYKPEKGQDYKFIDRQASEMFQVGGVDVYFHKYLGANTDASNASPSQPHYATNKVTNIQDLLFLENRDRIYDPEIYRIRGFYNVQNIDFNMSQFGLFLDSDTLYLTVHINDTIKLIGRKPVNGDVLEFPNLKDNYAINDYDYGMPRYYVVDDITRAAEGYSVTWQPHLYRIKLKRITDSQQFAQIFNQAAVDANGDPVADGTTLKDLISTYNKELELNSQVVAQAEADAPKSGYETRQFYTMAVDPTTGKPNLATADESDLLASGGGLITASGSEHVPVRTGYTGYLVGDGYPVNGYTFGFGIQFPANPATDDFYLRTDFLPNRLFRFDGNAWVKVEDAVRMNMTNNDTRQTQKTGFINNTSYIYNTKVGADYVALNANATVIDTRIPYNSTTLAALYVMLKLDATEIAYPAQVVSVPANPVTDYANIISNHSGNVRITLPIINSVQQIVPTSSIWTVELYNNREPVRQSLSQALKPRADF